MSPAPPRELARLAIRRAVPAFHREDAEPVASHHAVHLDRLCQRRRVRRLQLIVELQRNARPIEVRAKCRRGFERRDPWIHGCRQKASLSTRTSRSKAEAAKDAKTNC